jgi:hypothetical protein
MNSKQQKTLAAIFAVPTRSDILWSDIESLMQALGTEISPGAGSRVRCALNGVKAVFHRPHPERITTKGTVEDVRKFLRNAGVK